MVPNLRESLFLSVTPSDCDQPDSAHYGDDSDQTRQHSANFRHTANRAIDRHMAPETTRTYPAQVRLIYSVSPSNETQDQRPLARAGVFRFIILNSSFSLAARRPAVRCIAWLDVAPLSRRLVTGVLSRHRSPLFVGYFAPGLPVDVTAREGCFLERPFLR
jgi:hypothetical protein